MSAIELLDNLPEIPDETPTLNVMEVPLPQTRWVLGHNGVVQMIVKANSHHRHPFTAISGVRDAREYDTRQVGIPLSGWAVFRCNGHTVERGYLFDEKGNVTPQEGRTHPLRVGESALIGGPKA